MECITHRHDPIFVGTLGGRLLSAEVYPNIRPELKDMRRFGGITASKIVVDATKNWSCGRREEWGGDFFPPVAFRHTPDYEKLLAERWSEDALE